MTNHQTRHAARILVVDERRRVLLLRVDDDGPWHHNRPEMTTFWITPGGGVDPGEDHATAARRELYEETGITDARFGPCVWQLSRLLHFPDRSMLSIEHVYLAHVVRPQVTLANLLPYEVQLHQEFRWWTLTEIEQATDHFMPPTLATLLPPLFAGKLPTQPLEIDCTP
jgi:8-oxo-dGTP pyrophosphatase MutT (NUDIX family)